VEVVSLEVRPAAATAPSSPPSSDGSTVTLPGSSAIGYYLGRSEGTRAAITVQSQEKARLVVSLKTDETQEVVLNEIVTADGEWSVELPAHAQPVRLEMANYGPAAVTIARLSLSTPGADELQAPGRRLGAGKPDVVIFLADALRADVLGTYGFEGPTSPHLDRLAAEALVVEGFRAHTSWTQPAVASIFTGRAPGSHGVSQAEDLLVPQLVTLAEAFRAAGYRTAGFVANTVVNPRRGFRQGFEAWNDDPGLYGAPAEILVEEALRWLAAGSKPALIYIHTMEPHWPYEPDPEDWAPFEPSDYRGERDASKLLERQKGLMPEEVQYLRSLYLGAVRKNDRAFGTLVEGLEEMGSLDEALVVFTADHGEELHDHGGLQHRYTLYEEVLRIPLVIRFPGGVSAGRRDPGPAEQADLFPTLAALLDLGGPAATDGRDLSTRWLTAAASADPGELYGELRHGDLTKVAVVSEGKKLILNSGPAVFWPLGVRVELYDLDDDPGERINRARHEPITVGYLRSRARQLARELERSRASVGAGERLALSDDERKKLRALGYIE
jgi:arylsulfatase A-like enzyme